MGLLDKIGDKIDNITRTRAMRKWEPFRLGDERRHELFELYHRRRGELNTRYCDIGAMEWIRRGDHPLDLHIVDNFINYYLKYGPRYGYDEFEIDNPRDSFVILPTVFRTRGNDVPLVIRFGFGEIDVSFDGKRQVFQEWKDVIAFLDSKCGRGKC